MTFSIGSLSNSEKEITKYILYWGTDIDLINKTGGLDSPYVIAIFPLRHGPDREQQTERVELFKAILNQHQELTPELSKAIQDRTRAALEAERLKRQAGVSDAERPTPSAL